MRIILHVLPWRPAIDAAQQQMLHRVEADRTQRERVFDGFRDFFKREGLQQPRYPHIRDFRSVHTREAAGLRVPNSVRFDHVYIGGQLTQAI